jgi:peptidyl-tRNA hydrolase, PTH1 family
MKVVVGLGNPGRKYAGTRHNVGFLVLRELAARHKGGNPQMKFEAECVDIYLGQQKILLAAPQTYMNLSGRSVRQIVDFFQISPDDVLVVCDDLNLDLGRLRFRRSGSSGGQKGLRDILSRLATEDVPRLRIGIGQAPPRMDAADYVLQQFRSQERDVVERTIEMAADGIETWITEGIEAAMNRFNKSPTD